MRLRDLLFNDLGWKLFSVLLAAFIWYTVQKIIEEPRPAALSPASRSAVFGEVPVSVVSAGADPRSFGISSNTVSVTVSGLKEVMDILEAGQIHALVEVPDENPKSKDLLRNVEVSVPWGVTVIDVEPAKLRLIPPPHP